MSEHGSEGGSGVMSSFKGENGMLNIMLVVALVGSVASQYAPGLLAPLSGIIGEPLNSILYVYTLTFFLYTMIGEEKDAGEILKKLMPILMIVIVAGEFFKTGVNTTWYVTMIVAAPLFGKAARNLLNGGIWKLAGKWSGKGKAKDVFETLAGGEKKGHDEHGAGMIPNWDRSGVIQLYEMDALLTDLRLKVSKFNEEKEPFEEAAKELAKIFRVRASGKDKLDKKFPKVVEQLKKDVKDHWVTGTPIPANIAHAKAEVSAKIAHLHPLVEPLKKAIIKMSAHYDVGEMITFKSHELKEDITESEELVEETEKQIKELEEILHKIV